MTFKVVQQEQTLMGLEVGPLQIVSSHRMEKILWKTRNGILVQLSSLAIIESKIIGSKDLQPILSKNASTFEEPMSLPPLRSHDHAI